MIIGEYQPQGIVIAGGPHTGKTSYLALLYLAIVGDHAPGLRLGHYRDDREYLNRIAGHLQRCQPALRTEVAEQQRLALSLVVGQQREAMLLEIPDASGETWDQALSERQLPADLEERVGSASCVMIFTHPREGFNTGSTIVDTTMAEAALGVSPVVEDGGTAAARVPHVHAPTQVELVDLMQMLREHRGPRPSRACVIVSAYDLVPPSLSPAEWVARNCPLLDQYIRANRSWLDVAVFGVSAQGGRFDAHEERARLAAQDVLGRASVRASDGSPVAVEEPVLWALKGADG